MSVKIDVPKAWALEVDGVLCSWADFERDDLDEQRANAEDKEFVVRVRIVRESDWRRVMAVVRAAEWEREQGVLSPPANAAFDLRKHLARKRK